MLNLVLLILSFAYAEDLGACVNKLRHDLATDWVAVGLAMTIAALSQWSTISIYHLFLCATFAVTIQGVTQSDDIGRLRIIYFMAFRMLRIVLLIYFLYRFVRFWGNAPGQCFHLSMEIPIPWLRVLQIPDDVNEKFAITFMAFSILGDVLACMMKPVTNYDKPTWLEANGGILILCSSIMGIQIVLANRTQIIGNENSIGFGQVTALVTLVTTFYKIGESIHGKPCVPS